MAQISDLYQQKNDKRLSLESLKDIDRRLSILERQAQAILLDIKVCDPAMGSGHFLVETVDYLTDKLIKIINFYGDYNPILKILREIRQGILDNLQQQGITVSTSALDDDKLLKRVVMKRCIYGVDLNPMAVELAKVSLWLHSFTIGAPLSFLDHHLRCGNSLIGTTAREAEVAMSQDQSGQRSLFTGPFVGLLRSAQIMRGVSVLSDATFAEVEQSERLFKQFDDEVKPFKQLLDVYVSQFFGVKQAKNLLERLGERLINIDVSTMNQADFSVVEDSRNLYEQKRFFHWDLEFPEVFIDLETANWSENPGFDAVIGNPPYGFQLNSLDKNYYAITSPAKYHGRKPDIYVFFLLKSAILCQNKGILGMITPNAYHEGLDTQAFRQYLLSNFDIINLVILPSRGVWNDCSAECTISIFVKEKVNSSCQIVLTTFDNIENSLSDNKIDNNHTIEQDFLYNQLDYSIRPRQSDWLSKIELNSSTLNDFYEVCQGIIAYTTRKQSEEGKWIKSFSEDNQWKPLLDSGDNLERYIVHWCQLK